MLDRSTVYEESAENRLRRMLEDFSSKYADAPVFPSELPDEFLDMIKKGFSETVQVALIDVAKKYWSDLKDRHIGLN